MHLAPRRRSASSCGTTKAWASTIYLRVLSSSFLPFLPCPSRTLTPSRILALRISLATRCCPVLSVPHQATRPCPWPPAFDPTIAPAAAPSSLPPTAHRTPPRAFATLHYTSAAAVKPPPSQLPTVRSLLRCSLPPPVGRLDTLSARRSLSHQVPPGARTIEACASLCSERGATYPSRSLTVWYVFGA